MVARVQGWLQNFAMPVPEEFRLEYRQARVALAAELDPGEPPCLPAACMSANATPPTYLPTQPTYLPTYPAWLAGWLHTHACLPGCLAAHSCLPACLPTLLAGWLAGWLAGCLPTCLPALQTR